MEPTCHRHCFGRPGIVDQAYAPLGCLLHVHKARPVFKHDGKFWKRKKVLGISYFPMVTSWTNGF